MVKEEYMKNPKNKLCFQEKHEDFIEDFNNQKVEIQEVNEAFTIKTINFT